MPTKNRNITPELLELCKQHKRESQKQLYQLLLPFLQAVALRYLGNRSYLKDVLQESFVLIFSHLDRYDPVKGSIKSWSAKITIRQALNYNSRIILNTNQQGDIPHDSRASSSPADTLFHGDLLDSIRAMPHDLYVVFNLVVVEGYSHREIARMLDIKPSLSRQRLCRARTWIQKLMKKNEVS